MRSDADMTGRTVLMSGGSRGIGLAIASAVAARGANVVLLAKTDVPDQRLPGTIHTAVQALREVGGNAVGVVGDVRSEADVQRAVTTAVEAFGSIDVVVNNASAITTAPTVGTTTKRFTLMHEVNVRGTWLLTTTALPHLLAADPGRVLTLAPPLNLAPRWLGAHPAYTTSKYAMTMLTLGWAEEFRSEGIGACCLWPETLIDTAAVRNVVSRSGRARSPLIMADAAQQLLTWPVADTTGRTFIDADVVRAAGQDLARYGATSDFDKDLFVD